MREPTQATKLTEDALIYLERLKDSFNKKNLKAVEKLAMELYKAWKNGNNVYICGNGGSAANAVHLANDLHYGIGACGLGPKIPGIRVEALSANTGVVTCLANDTGYENIYSHQIDVKGRRNDILIALSGSGNSINIVRAIEASNSKGLKTFAIVGFKGGKCKEIASNVIHFEIEDMQIAEDTQLIVDTMYAVAKQEQTRKYRKSGQIE